MSLYGFARCLAKLLYKALFKIEILGEENLPETDGFIAVCNHKSNFDAPLIAAALPRQLTFMAKEELFKIKPFGFVLKKLGAFPIKRGTGDLGAIRATLGILKNGGNILIFPEGTREKEKGKMLEGKPGAALIAHKSGAALVPVGIKGEYGFRKKLTVSFGEPIIPGNHLEARASSDSLKEFTDKIIMPSISKLCGSESKK